MLAAEFVGCGQNDGGPEDSTSVGETSSAVQTETEPAKLHYGNPDLKVYAEAYLESVPTKDFAGTTFFITAPSTTPFDSDGATYLSKEVAERNKKVEEKLNIKISSSQKDVDTMLAEVIGAVAADMYYSDIMMVPIHAIGSFAANNTLMNLRSLPSLDMSAPYFNGSSVKALSAGFWTYGIAGDASPILSDLPVLYYNTDIINSYGGTPLHDVAKNGAFTWDVFFECIASVNEKNADGTLLTVGAGSIIDRVPELIFTSVGGTIVSSGELKYPKVSFSPDDLELSASRSAKLYNDPHGALVDSGAATEAFKNGKLAFIFDVVSNADSLQSENVNWGILPMPKADAESSYKSLVSRNTPVFTVVANTTNSELASLATSSLCAASYGYMKEKYVDYIHVNSMRNNESCDVLDAISNTAVFDFSSAFGESSPAIAAGTYGFIRQALKTGDAASGYDAVVYEANMTMQRDFPTSN